MELGSIAIPAIGIERTMYEGIRMPTLDRGPGHWPGTAMPGQPGNVVVAGHRVSNNADFRDLDQLQPGDEVTFTSDGQTHSYVVDEVTIVEPEDTWIVDQTARPTATLFACHPPGSVSQRIVAHLSLRHDAPSVDTRLRPAIGTAWMWQLTVPSLLWVITTRPCQQALARLAEL